MNALRISSALALVTGVLATGLLAGVAPASAHPHVWVNVETSVVYDGGKITGLKHRWTFDDMYTAMAIQGLDKNQDGTYTREELAELAQVNIDGLKDFEYFTYPALAEQKLTIETPQEYWLEHTDGVLSLHFFVPLKSPVLAEAQGFSFKVYDPSYFIAFDLAEKNPVRLTGTAPDGCTVDISVPENELEQTEDLSDAFLSQFGGNFGISLAKTVSVRCARI